MPAARRVVGTLQSHAAGPVRVVPDHGVRGARAVVCPTCHAGIGSPCRRPSGHEVWGSSKGAVHKERADLAGQVSIEGLLCADCRTPDGPGSYVAPLRDQRLGPAGMEVCEGCARKRANAGGLSYAAHFGYTGVTE